MALLHLAHRWARGRGVSLHALTVDHGLRPDSAAEAAGVAAFCAAHGIAHRILTWSGDGDGNLPDAARRGRYAAMADACTEAGATMLLTGHTLDDQAETVLMRLGRGSGVDGLAAMRAMTPLWGVQLFRPLLGLRREDLRDMLRGAGVAWVDDPTNEDRGYTRIRARDALAQLAPLGITPERLAATANAMADAQAVLEAQATALENATGGLTPLGYVQLNPLALSSAPRDTAHRLLSRWLCQVSGAVYRPRREALEALLHRMGQGDFGGATLHGCRIDPMDDGIVIQREPNACTAITVSGERAIWDNRFRIEHAPSAPDIHITATGEAGLRHLKAAKTPLSPAWRAAPRPARACTPALWRGGILLAVPLAGYAIDPAASLCRVAPMSSMHASMVDPVNEAFI